MTIPDNINNYQPHPMSLLLTVLIPINDAAMTLTNGKYLPFN